MNLCLDKMAALFQGDTRCAAIAVAVIAFVLGMVVMAAVLRCLCRCRCKAEPKAAGRQQAKASSGEKPFEKRKPHPAPADGSVEIYVGNLSYDLPEDQLRKEFEAYGKVNSVRIITNRYNGKSKGFGFVHMPNRAEVDAAVAALSDKEVCGRRLKCNEAKNVG